jgi:hypothetical protein
MLGFAAMWLMGCAGPQRPTGTELAGPGARPLTQTNLRKGVAVLAQRDSGELVITAWTEAGKRETFVGRGAPSSPVVGWMDGEAIVGGYHADARAERVELRTPDQHVYQGKLVKGAYLFTWTAPEMPQRFIVRVLDHQGNELYRWPPAGLPAA